jgi:hypothetical protein
MIVFFCAGMFFLVPSAASPLRYLSYYTFDFFKYGSNITALGSANLAPPLNDDPIAAAIFHDLHGLPSMITPGRITAANNAFSLNPAPLALLAISDT